MTNVDETKNVKNSNPNVDDDTDDEGKGNASSVEVQGVIAETNDDAVITETERTSSQVPGVQPLIVDSNTEGSKSSQSASDVYRKTLVKPGQIVKFTSQADQLEGKVISRAGKRGGKHENWYNIDVGGERGICAFDLGQAENMTVIDMDKESTEEVMLCDMSLFDSAKEAELRNWNENDVYVEVKNVGQDYISCRWVLTKKDDGTMKARLVARGFEDEELSPQDKQSPTCSKEAIRCVLAFAISANWPLKSLDIKAAFLQGEVSSRNVILLPPKEANTTNLWQLRKCVYGLSDASLKWYEKVQKTLLSLGCTMVKPDRAVFCYYSEKQMIGIIAVHVDDFIWTGNQWFEENVIASLYSKLCVGKSYSEVFKYLGLDVIRQANIISVDQNRYIREIEFLQSSCNDLHTWKAARATVGKLMWVASQTRPDLSFIVNSLLSVKHVIGIFFDWGSLCSKNPRICRIKIVESMHSNRARASAAIVLRTTLFSRFEDHEIGEIRLVLSLTKTMKPP